MDFSTPIENIPRVGPVLQKRLKGLGIRTVLDLLFYFPSQYKDFSNLIPISQVKINEICTIQGRILEIKTTRTWKKKMFLTEAIIEDKTGAIKATWFGQPYLDRILKKNDFVFISGKIIIGNNEAYFSNPTYEKTYSMADDLDEVNSNKLTHTGRIVPIYPETKGLSSRWLRSTLKFILASSGGRIPETLPEKIITEQKLLDINRALWEIHFPSSFPAVNEAKKRFSFEELFYIELFVLRERAKLNREKAYSIPFKLELIKELVSLLPFQLTDGQRKSAYQILKDIEKSRPMNRLLQGDVGSGKTVVAAIAALSAIKAGLQTAFMAPTEILSKQHFQEIAKLLGNFNLNIGLLTGKQDQFRSKKLKNDIVEISRKKLLEKTLKGEIDILIGTHALIQDKVKFGKLGLVILDEQHRFGVEQRAKLVKNSKIIPHLLSMTATPIPRTLSLTIYGDLDLSLIDELPKGRKKIITEIVEPEDRAKTYEFIRSEIEKGGQIFVICPRIEKSEKEIDDISGWSEVKAVKEEYKKLSQTIFPDLKVKILHGKMTSKEKEQIMKDFKNKKIQILVSTSVVEVGIDVPNATVMMIEGADRFGLAQLHQFRGRVGRGERQSYCLLFTDSTSSKTKQRLKALITCENGFQLAEKDLELRGPGDFSGTRQWGIPDLMMDSLKDIRLVEKTREIAKEILMEDPYLKKYPQLEIKLARFRNSIHME
jgi:ATP-dependent DNA helicase RecG